MMAPPSDILSAGTVTAAPIASRSGGDPAPSRQRPFFNAQRGPAGCTHSRSRCRKASLEGVAAAPISVVTLSVLSRQSMAARTAKGVDPRHWRRRSGSRLRCRVPVEWWLAPRPSKKTDHVSPSITPALTSRSPQSLQVRRSEADGVAPRSSSYVLRGE